MLTRWAALAIVALLVGPALPRSASACSRVAQVQVGDCRGPASQPARRKPPRGPSLTQRVFAQVNEARVAGGRRQLVWNAHAADIASRHAARMARSGRLFHNPKVRTSSGRRSLGLPRSVGENVGVGPDISAIHQAFMDSGGHRRQILSRSYRSVGIGVAERNGEVYVTQLFVGSGSVARGYGAAAATRASPPAKQKARAAETPPAETRAAAETELLAMPAPEVPSFPWLATTPTLALGGLALLRRRRRRRAWTV